MIEIRPSFAFVLLQVKHQSVEPDDTKMQVTIGHLLKIQDIGFDAVGIDQSIFMMVANHDFFELYTAKNCDSNLIDLNIRMVIIVDALGKVNGELRLYHRK